MNSHASGNVNFGQKKESKSKDGDQMVSACVAPTVKRGGGGGGVMAWGCVDANTVQQLFRIPGMFKKQSEHKDSTSTCHPIWFTPSFTYQRDNDP